MGHRYGDFSYWNERYDNERDDPFDWLVEFDQVKEIFDLLVPKDSRVLVIGCGNAPFSHHMYEYGYHDITNIDTSEIVIEQQKASFPEEKWEVMDVREMRFEDGSFDLVVDKSVLDCLLCYAESHENTHRMLEEVRRVLCPTGLYLVVSLHSVKDVLTHVQALDWRVNPHRVANARWDEGENSRRAVTYAFVLCGMPEREQVPVELPGTVTPAQHRQLLARQKRINLGKTLKVANTTDLSLALELAVQKMRGVRIGLDENHEEDSDEDDDDDDDDDDDYGYGEDDDDDDEGDY
jgi:SAM-dependent methyltransferase